MSAADFHKARTLNHSTGSWSQNTASTCRNVSELLAKRRGSRTCSTSVTKIGFCCSLPRGIIPSSLRSRSMIAAGIQFGSKVIQSATAGRALLRKAEGHRSGMPAFASTPRHISNSKLTWSCEQNTEKLKPWSKTYARFLSHGTRRSVGRFSTFTEQSITRENKQALRKYQRQPSHFVGKSHSHLLKN